MLISPAHRARCSLNAGLILGQRRRRWPWIKPALYRRLSLVLGLESRWQRAHNERLIADEGASVHTHCVRRVHPLCAVTTSPWRHHLHCNGGAHVTAARVPPPVKVRDGAWGSITPWPPVTPVTCPLLTRVTPGVDPGAVARPNRWFINHSDFS